MKNAMYLNSDLVRYAKDNVDALLKKLDVLIKNSSGVLSGDTIRFEILYIIILCVSIMCYLIYIHAFFAMLSPLSRISDSRTMPKGQTSKGGRS